MFFVNCVLIKFDLDFQHILSIRDLLRLLADGTVTQQEVERGLMRLDAATRGQHAIVFLRNIDGVYDDLSSRSAQKHGSKFTFIFTLKIKST